MQFKRFRRIQAITFYAWTAVDDVLGAAPQPKPKRDPLALARHYQALLDDGTAKNQADLARILGVSRPRVNQVLRRLNGRNGHKANADNPLPADDATRDT